MTAETENHSGLGPTLTAIQVSVATLAGEVRTLNATLEGRIRTQENELKTLRNKVQDAPSEDRVKAVEQDVKTLQDWQTWAQRLVLGLVAAAVLTGPFLLT